MLAVAVVVVEPVVVEPVVVEPVVVEPVVVEPAGLAGVPSIVAFRSWNGIFKFCDTCRAAMN